MYKCVCVYKISYLKYYVWPGFEAPPPESIIYCYILLA